jgi:hypothetical protein
MLEEPGQLPGGAGGDASHHFRADLKS